MCSVKVESSNCKFFVVLRTHASGFLDLLATEVMLSVERRCHQKPKWRSTNRQQRGPPSDRFGVIQMSLLASLSLARSLSRLSSFHCLECPVFHAESCTVGYNKGLGCPSFQRFSISVFSFLSFWSFLSATFPQSFFRCGAQGGGRGALDSCRWLWSSESWAAALLWSVVFADLAEDGAYLS